MPIIPGLQEEWCISGAVAQSADAQKKLRLLCILRI
jgi:hypothetical protein